MARIAMELLEKEYPIMQKLNVKIKEIKNFNWSSKKKVANFQKENFCKPCNSKTHSAAECWGPCEFCRRRNHQKEYCRFKENMNN